MTRARILADYVAGGTTAAEFDYMDGVTSNVQTQLDAKLALAGGTMTGDLVPSTPLSHRNMIINGAMNVAQRGGSGTGVGYTCADRFQRVADNNAGVTTARVSEAPVGFENSYKVTITTADTSITSTQYEFHEQQIEGNNIYHLEWGTSDAKTVTLSFYVRSSLAGVFGGSIRNSANNRAYSFEYTINSANTWERKTITIAGDTTGTWLKSNLAGLKIEWALGSGSSFHGSAGWSAGHFLTKDVARSNDSADALLATVNATWQITGVQLELGSNATPFEHRSYGDELARCMRYYEFQTYSGCVLVGYNTGVGRGCVYFSTTKRIEGHSTTVNVPDNTTYYQNTGYTTNVITAMPEFQSIRIGTDDATSGVAQYINNLEIRVDAEL